MPEEQVTFYPRGALICVAGSMVPSVFYTLPVDTRRYTNVTVGLCVDMPNWDTNATVSIAPQISNGGGMWDTTTPTFSSPFAPPYYDVIKITTVGSLMRFLVQVTDMVTPPPPIGNLDFGITFSLVGTGHYDEGEFVEHAIWPPRSIITNVPAQGSKYIYSEPFPTSQFTELVCALRCDTPVIGGGALVPTTGEIVGYIETSNDRVNWETQAAFTALNPGSTYPSYEVKSYTELAQFARMKFALNNTGMAAVDVGGTLYAQCLGRW